MAPDERLLSLPRPTWAEVGVHDQPVQERETMSRRGYKTAGDHPRPPFRLTSHAHFNDMALRIIGRPLALTAPLAPSALTMFTAW